MSSLTPEGKIKNKIRRVLDKYKVHRIYTYMPVPGGFGAPTLDYLGFLYGRGFAIEAKKPGGKPTPRQQATIEALRKAGAQVFVVHNDDTLRELDEWLSLVVGFATATAITAV